MKKSILLSVILFSVTLASAQVVSEKVKITTDQVPLSVKQAFEKAIGSIPDGGHWSARFNRSTTGSRVVAIPVSYTYTNRTSKEKIEVRFSPEGNILQSRGVVLREAKVTEADGADGQEKN
jgi:hypothetical protein